MTQMGELQKLLNKNIPLI